MQRASSYHAKGTSARPIMRPSNRREMGEALNERKRQQKNQAFQDKKDRSSAARARTKARYSKATAKAPRRGETAAQKYAREVDARSVKTQRRDNARLKRSNDFEAKRQASKRAQDPAASYSAAKTPTARKRHALKAAELRWHMKQDKLEGYSPDANLKNQVAIATKRAGGLVRSEGDAVKAMKRRTYQGDWHDSWLPKSEQEGGSNSRAAIEKGVRNRRAKIDNAPAGAHVPNLVERKKMSPQRKAGKQRRARSAMARLPASDKKASAAHARKVDARSAKKTGGMGKTTKAKTKRKSKGDTPAGFFK